MILSICITSYNNLPYLSKLISQIEKQYYKISGRVEFLLYDDDSSDLRMKSYFMQIDNTIFRKFKSETRTFSPATGRNVMLDNAKAKYVLFIDGDDFLGCEITDIINELINLNSDVLLSFPYYVDSLESKIDADIVFSKNILTDNNKEFNKNKRKYAIHQTGIWSIYKRDFLIKNKLYYPTGVRSEDHLFMHNILNYEPNIWRIKSRYYCWRLNEVSHSNSDNVMQSNILFLKLAIKNIEKQKNKNSQNEIVYNLFNTSFSNAVRGYPKMNYKQRRIYFNANSHIISMMPFKGDFDGCDIYFKMFYKYNLKSRIFFEMLYNMYKIIHFNYSKEISNKLYFKKRKKTIRSYTITSYKHFLVKPDFKKTYLFKKKRILNFYNSFDYKIVKNLNNHKYLNSSHCLLFFDRINMANDSAEVLYEKMKNYSNKYFVLDANSEDYTRLKNKGFNMVDYNSELFIELYKKCDYIFSSSFDIEITNFKNLRTKFKFVFLQHGVIYNDLTHHLNNRDIDYIVCSTYFERELLVSNYQFFDFQLIHSGLCRYDKLKKENNGSYGLVCLTWRSNLRLDHSYEINTKLFLNSNYFKQIKYLMSDENNKLLLHPNLIQMKELLNCLYGKDRILSDKYDDILNESKYLITDYSSIMFDYIYMGKNVFLYQFDKEQFYNEHIHRPQYDLSLIEDCKFISCLDDIKPYQNKSAKIFLNENSHSQYLIDYLEGKIK